MACCILGALLIGHTIAIWHWLTSWFWIALATAVSLTVGLSLFVYHREHVVQILAAVFTGEAPTHHH